MADSSLAHLPRVISCLLACLSALLSGPFNCRLIESTPATAAGGAMHLRLVWLCCCPHCCHCCCCSPINGSASVVRPTFSGSFSLVFTGCCMTPRRSVIENIWRTDARLTGAAPVGLHSSFNAKRSLKAPDSRWLIYLRLSHLARQQ